MNKMNNQWMIKKKADPENSRPQMNEYLPATRHHL